MRRQPPRVSRGPRPSQSSPRPSRFPTTKDPGNSTLPRSAPCPFPQTDRKRFGRDGGRREAPSRKPRVDEEAPAWFELAMVVDGREVRRRWNLEPRNGRRDVIEYEGSMASP